MLSLPPSLGRPLPAALALGAAASAALLAGAHAFERIGGYAPCLLCLDQREVHWVALTVALASLGLLKLKARRLALAGLGVLCLVFAFSAGLATYHAGAEWGWWEGPAACAASGAVDIPTAGGLLESLDKPGPSGPPCTEAAWRMLGLSMAGYNALISAALSAAAALAGLAALDVLRGVDAGRRRS